MLRAGHLRKVSLWGWGSHTAAGPRGMPAGRRSLAALGRSGHLQTQSSRATGQGKPLPRPSPAPWAPSGARTSLGGASGSATAPLAQRCSEQWEPWVPADHARGLPASTGHRGDRPDSGPVHVCACVSVVLGNKQSAGDDGSSFQDPGHRSPWPLTRPYATSPSDGAPHRSPGAAGRPTAETELSRLIYNVSHV